MVLAAGFGTRLKPWTDFHPKALVEVGEVPMLKRVVDKLISQGFDRIVVNVHHFSGQIVKYLSEIRFDAEILISDESDRILDTGGGIVKAYTLFGEGAPMLIHNVDILSDADLRLLMERHIAEDAQITLLTSDRESSRKLYFDNESYLRGWRNMKTCELKPVGLNVDPSWKLEAFSGIHVVSEEAVADMKSRYGSDPFPVMDYLLAVAAEGKVKRYHAPSLHLIDIGKPATLSQANDIFR